MSHGAKMKPTEDQTNRVEAWLELRARAIVAHRASPKMLQAVEEDLRSGADFSESYSKFGFASDGFICLPNFNEIFAKWKEASKRNA
jgi:hypothetical protein